MGTTSVSTLTTMTPCYYVVLTLTVKKACAATGRKKRAVIMDPMDEEEALDTVIPSAKKTDLSLEPGMKKEDGSAIRRARQFLYYMTTTSTTTSTSSSFISTYSLTLLSCTPSGIINMCG